MSSLKKNKKEERSRTNPSTPIIPLHTDPSHQSLQRKRKVNKEGGDMNSPKLHHLQPVLQRSQSEQLSDSGSACGSRRGSTSNSPGKGFQRSGQLESELQQGGVEGNKPGGWFPGSYTFSASGKQQQQDGGGEGIQQPLVADATCCDTYNAQPHADELSIKQEEEMEVAEHQVPPEMDVTPHPPSAPLTTLVPSGYDVHKADEWVPLVTYAYLQKLVPELKEAEEEIGEFFSDCSEYIYEHLSLSEQAVKSIMGLDAHDDQTFYRVLCALMLLPDFKEKYGVPERDACAIYRTCYEKLSGDYQYNASCVDLGILNEHYNANCY